MQHPFTPSKETLCVYADPHTGHCGLPALSHDWKCKRCGAAGNGIDTHPCHSNISKKGGNALAKRGHDYYRALSKKGVKARIAKRRKTGKY